MDALGRKWGDTLAHAAVATESPIFERLRRGEALLVRADLGVGGLAIALGDLVDDAIIDTENIYRRLRGNQAAAVPRAAHAVIYDASLEVRFSVVYASFIVALVLVPLVTLSGVAGRLFAPLGSRYILALLASLAVALTVTPALSALLLNRSRWPRARTAANPLVAAALSRAGATPLPPRDASVNGDRARVCTVGGAAAGPGRSMPWSKGRPSACRRLRLRHW